MCKWLPLSIIILSADKDNITSESFWFRPTSKMASKYLGNIVSINCGEILGIYKGQVQQIDPVDQTITLIKVIRNGVPCSPPKITLGVQDIQEIQIEEQTSAQNNIEGVAHAPQIKSDCSAFDAVKNQNNNESLSKLDEAKKKEQGEIRKKTLTPKKVDSRRKLTNRDEACFNEPVDDFVLETEFDFEKNLALFDKQAVFEQIDSLSHKPDIVRLVDCNRRSQQQKYQCDEHVLEHAPVVCRQIGVPCVIEKEFVTDAGLIVPSITREMRQHILNAADSVGFKSPRRIEMVGRAAAEMILQLLGGNHRLNPQNVHQRPTVVVLCGLHLQGAQGVNCARHLANHGVNVTLLCMPFTLGVPLDPKFKDEFIFFSMSGGKETRTIGELPPNIDILICALDSVEDPCTPESFWQKAVVQWANQCRAPALSLDPPPNGTSLHPKWILCPLLPFAFPCEPAGGPSLYLCDLGLPKEVLARAGVTYTSPFGSKFIVPLYDRASHTAR